MIRIVTDSTSDLSRELLDEYGIEVLPLHVLLGEDEYLDGKNITPEKIYEWSDASGKTPKTSAPSMSDAIELFEPIISGGDEIIAFSISTAMSTSYNCMQIAADNLDSADCISIIDSANLSTGIGLLVVKAAMMAKSGMDRATIVDEINRLIPLVRASFVVDTLTYLHRGGRCSGLAALAGGALKLHPKISVENGKMEVGKKYRGDYHRIVLNYAKEMEEELLKADCDYVFITHSGIDGEVEQSVYEYLDSLKHFKNICITRAGGVVSSHCGYGTLGVLYIAAE